MVRENGWIEEAVAKSITDKFIDESMKEPEKGDDTRTPSEQVKETLILSKLYEDGFITKSKGMYTFDTSMNIENKWGDDGAPNDTTKDIREILRRTMLGLPQGTYKISMIPKGRTS